MRSPTSPPTSPSSDWRTHLEALARSGQSVPAYAAEHGIKADTLYRWRRRHRAQPESEAPARSPRLLPVSVEVTPTCELLLPDGRRLRFPATLPAATLRAWLAALGAS